jgi:hypothetical protein
MKHLLVLDHFGQENYQTDDYLYGFPYTFRLTHFSQPNYFQGCPKLFESAVQYFPPDWVIAADSQCDIKELFKHSKIFQKITSSSVLIAFHDVSSAIITNFQVRFKAITLSTCNNSPPSPASVLLVRVRLSVVYLMILSVSRIYSVNGRMNDGLKRIWEEAVVA